MEAKKKFFFFFNFLDAMQLICPTMQLIFTIKSMKILGEGELMTKQKILQILSMARRGEVLACQVAMN